MANTNSSSTKLDCSSSCGKSFRVELERILRRLGTRWKDLAGEAGLKPQQLSDTIRTDPSAVVLRGLWGALQKRGALKDMIRMAVTGVAVDRLDSDTRAVLDSLPVPFSQKGLIEDPTLKTRCVVNYALGEGYDREILSHTLNQIQQHETEYFYFCSYANSEKRQVHAYAENEISGSTSTLEKRAYFIQAPRALFFSRIQIDNVGTPYQKAHYILGSPGVPVVVEAEPMEVEQMGETLYEVVLRVQSGEREIRVLDSSDGLDLRFKVVD